MIIIGFAMEELENATDMAVSLLKKYAGAENVETKNVTIG
jgi:hypothetical protein